MTRMLQQNPAQTFILDLLKNAFTDYFLSTGSQSIIL